MAPEMQTVRQARRSNRNGSWDPNTYWGKLRKQNDKIK